MVAGRRRPSVRRTLLSSMLAVMLALGGVPAMAMEATNEGAVLEVDGNEAGTVGLGDEAELDDSIPCSWLHTRRQESPCSRASPWGPA